MANRGLNVSLWIVQALLAAGYITNGSTKLGVSIQTLSQKMPWIGEHPTLAHVTALVDIAGGLGLLLPALTRIKPGLTVLAALGCSLLQVSAIIFHVSRGEAMLTPLNFVLLVLSLFVLWGRGKKVPIRSRS